jgi:hypothetical protein
VAEQQVPRDAVVTAKALRLVATWLPEEYQDMLREAAGQTEGWWDSLSCPVCQETWCDEGCPLEDIRASLGLSLTRLRDHGL